MPVKAPAERNFRRAPAKAARRRRFRPRLSWTVARRVLSLLLFVFGIYQSLAFAFTTPLLRVSRISVHGNVRLSSGEVQALVDDLRGTSILRVDLEAFRRRLVESPWIAEVGLRRVLPSTVEIFVSERRPIGLCRMGPDLYLVDETGTVIDQFGPQYSEFDLPIVDGLVSPGGGGANGSIDTGRAELAARVIAELGRNKQIAQPAVAGRRGRRARRARAPRRRHGAPAPRRGQVPGACPVVPGALAGAARAGQRHRLRRPAVRVAGLRAPDVDHGPRRRAAGIRSSGGRKEAFLVAHTMAMNPPTTC